jgi:DNA helicase-2/ATP-dependent DNA helicase PcrA
MADNSLTKICPRCGGIMTKKNGKYGQFFGCSNYYSKNCKYTEKIQYVKESPAVLNNDQIEDVKKWSKYQIDIFEAVKFLKNSLGIEATAGSGKSTVLKEIAKILRGLYPDAEIIALVFGKDAANDLKRKMGNLIDARTSHSLALYNIKKIYKYSKSIVDSEKYPQIFANYLKNNEADKEDLLRNRSAILTAINLIRDLMLDTSLESLEWLSSNYEQINFNGDTRIIVSAIDYIYKTGRADSSVLDFGDMLLLCAENPSYCKQYDYILLDEAQDSNASQLQFFKNSLKPSGKIIFVGDTSQGIYAFRGSMSNAMQILQNAFNADMLPLSVSYRCPVSHIAYVKGLLPDSNIEAAPNAIEGNIFFGKFDKFSDNIEDGSLLLCRNNAPLIKPAFRLLTSGRKVIIKGKEIGLELINLILKIKKLYSADSIYNFAEGLNAYRQSESDKLMKLNYLRKLESLLDKLDCIEAFISESDSIDSMITSIDKIFSNDDHEGIIFSTVHKAKGMESNSVYILGPELMPSSKAKSDEDKKQEDNIRFVAYTRSKNNLFVVQTDK